MPETLRPRRPRPRRAAAWWRSPQTASAPVSRLYSGAGRPWSGRGPTWTFATNRSIEPGRRHWRRSAPAPGRRRSWSTTFSTSRASSPERCGCTGRAWSCTRSPMGRAARARAHRAGAPRRRGTRGGRRFQPVPAQADRVRGAQRCRGQRGSRRRSRGLTRDWSEREDRSVIPDTSRSNELNTCRW